jgi:hypothetical protein
MAFLDTHKAIERIISTGVSKETAEAIVDSVNTKNDDVATKADIHELKAEISIMNTNIKWIIAIGLLIVGLLLKNAFI